VILELDVEGAPFEDVSVRRRGVVSLSFLPRQQVPADLGGQAAREPDEPGAGFGQEVLVDPGPVVEALDVRRGNQAQEVPIALLVASEDRQVAVVLVVFPGRAVET
jgi:hypothetical protein